MSLVEVFRTSPPRRQWVLVGLGVGVLCVVLFTLYFLVLHKPYAVLFSNLRTTDAATIVADLDKKKVPYRLEDGGATVLVPKNLVDATRLSVMSEDLPLKGMVGFELFNKSDMGLTEFAQKINYQRALQGELARTIMTMDEVDTARVHLSLTEPSIFREDRIPPKASVTILTRPGKILPSAAVRGIQRLIAAAVPDLDVGNVVVLDQRGEVLSGELAPETLTSPEMQARQAIEGYYAGRVRMALQRAYPANAVEVTVSAPALGLGGAPGGRNQAVEGWAPGARDFGLQVTISAAPPITPQLQDAFTSLAYEAIGFNPALGDSVTVLLAAAPAPLPTVAAAPLAASAPWTAPHSPTHRLLTLLTMGLALALPIVLLLIALAVLIERSRGRPRRLTAKQRDEYARRLKSLLEQGEADVGRAI